MNVIENERNQQQLTEKAAGFVKITSTLIIFLVL